MLKKIFKNITNIVLIVLVAILLLQRGCESPPRDTETITTIVTKYDTINTVTQVYVPLWNTRVFYDIDTISIPIDTTAVLQDYYTKYNYIDTFNLDTLGYIVINDTIFNNKIYSRQIFSNVLIPTTTITNTIYENKREFYVGLGANVTTNGEINFIGTEFVFKTKKKQMYGLGIGIDRDFTPTITGHLYWKIGKK